MSTRSPFSPSEFDAACRIIESRHPECWATSGFRSEAHNLDVGGHPDSKHALRPCMAQDYGASSVGELYAIAKTAVSLGLWFKVHAVERGGGIHTHIQGLPVGPIPEPWATLYMEGSA